jgi:hypothetical protein
VPASVNGSAGRNFVTLVNARSWFAARAIMPRRKARRSGGATGRCANIDSYLNADWLNEGIRPVCFDCRQRTTVRREEGAEGRDDVPMPSALPIFNIPVPPLWRRRDAHHSNPAPA